MKDYEERKYKGYTICIEYHGETPFKDRRIYVRDREGNRVEYFIRTYFYDSIDQAKWVINSVIEEADWDNHKNRELEYSDVESFLDQYDYYGSTGWILEIMSGNLDLELLKRAMLNHRNGNLEECQRDMDDLFSDKMNYDYWKENVK